MDFEMTVGKGGVLC